MFKWQVSSNFTPDGSVYQCWIQTRELRQDEPMHSGVRQYSKELFYSRDEAQEHADMQNAKL